jgi:predicted ATP-grasp superfamily ATP-dependent carboligase
MYTGAVENYPEIIEAIVAERELLGNPADVVRAVRDPWQVVRCLADHQLPAAALLRAGAPVPAGNWVRKPYRSGGGMNILSVHCRAGRPPPPAPASHYWQQFIPGHSASAVFVAGGGHSVLLGVTQQLIGCPWAGALAFRYAGSIGPLPIASDHRAQLERIGASLAASFALTGLFGIDTICNGDGVWTMEVNPRYTASIEVLERASSLRSIALHVSWCQGATRAIAPVSTGKRLHGKVVLYATRTTRIPPAFRTWVEQQNRQTEFPAVADIPDEGSVISPRRPICTLLTSGDSLSEVEAGLRKQVQSARRILQTPSGSSGW